MAPRLSAPIGCGKPGDRSIETGEPNLVSPSLLSFRQDCSCSKRTALAVHSFTRPVGAIICLAAQLSGFSGNDLNDRMSKWRGVGQGRAPSRRRLRFAARAAATLGAGQRVCVRCPPQRRPPSLAGAPQAPWRGPVPSQRRRRAVAMAAVRPTRCVAAGGQPRRGSG